MQLFILACSLAAVSVAVGDPDPDPHHDGTPAGAFAVNRVTMPDRVCLTNSVSFPFGLLVCRHFGYVQLCCPHRGLRIWPVVAAQPRIVPNIV